MDKPVAGIRPRELRESTNFEDIVIQKIRAYVESGKVSEFE